MIGYDFNNSNERLKEILNKKGIPSTKHASYVFRKLEGTPVEVTKASIARWFRGEGMPNSKHLQETMKLLELDDSEAVYYLLGINYTKPSNIPENYDSFLKMKVYASMDKHFRKNGVLDGELSKERLDGIFATIISIVSLSKTQVVDDKIVEMLCR